MGAFTSRQNQNAAVEAEQSSHQVYKYPPRSGNFFGSHFIMGGERFDTPQPESYLFGENADLNFLGNRPTAFPYPPPQANEPTKTLKSLVNIRKESVRFVRVQHENEKDSDTESNHTVEDTCTTTPPNEQHEDVDGNVVSAGSGDGSVDGTGEPAELVSPPICTCAYNIEFTFDSDAKCAITIYYFCHEEVSPSGVTLKGRQAFTSATYHYEKGINQLFSQPEHRFNPQVIPSDILVYNSSREQYPIAIHCVVEEGNEDCRQSHTTICVVDHHPESNSYVLRALKQKIFVDGLCYLLQEIYGIENKAVNKSSIDEEIDDHGSECVICMSETRDTLILPCRHLCLCNSCADSLRYQANNCPICRSPFRALLQIRAVQKGVASHVLHQNTPTSAAGEPTPCDQHMPAGYIPVSLIEALNGPPQFVARVRPNDNDITDGITNSIGPPVPTTDNHKATSPLKPNQRRPKIKKNASTSTNTSEVGTFTNTENSNNLGGLSVVEITNEINSNNSAAQKKSPICEKIEMPTIIRSSQDKLQIVNERQSLKVPKSKRHSSSINNNCNSNDVDEDDDSENEKLSPLLSPNSKNKTTPSPQPLQMSKMLSKDIMNAVIDTDNEHDGNAVEMKSTQSSLKKHKRPDLKTTSSQEIAVGNGVTVESTGINANEDSDYYTPEDTQNSILSPLCPERVKSGTVDKLGNLKINAGSFKAVNSLAKKNLHKKSTSVGNIVGPGGGGNNGVGVGVGVGDLKGNVSSLPDMLDSPISGNSASTRSSSDSYSSSSSTKQLLSSNPTTAAANIIVDDKTALQNAVNV